jgi:hypothetical protein
MELISRSISDRLNYWHLWGGGGEPPFLFVSSRLSMELVEERVAPAPPPFRTHRAQFRQWAQDKAIHVATGRELEQRMAGRNLRQRISPDI